MMKINKSFTKISAQHYYGLYIVYVIRKFKSFKKKAKETILFQGLKHKVKPHKSFNNTPQPTAPDYSNLQNWAAHPNVPNNSGVIPHGTSEVPDKFVADVFYIYPTLFFSNTMWNAPLDHIRTNEFVDNMILPGQTSVFNGSCRIFSPRYRQATFYSFLDGGQSCQQAFNLAYADIENAFNHYIEHDNKGRPFIIAGHSQGTLHGLRLLEECVDSSQLFDQFIAAYLIGFQIPEDKFGRTLKRITAAKTADDLHCVIGFDSYGEEGGPLHSKDKCQHYYKDTQDWEFRKHKKVAAINPLSWTTDSSVASSDLHIGGARIQLNKEVPFSGKQFFSDEPMGLSFKKLSEPITEECSARLDENGILHISTPKTRSFRVGLLPNWNYHIYDYALFYMNIKKNVDDRVRQYMNLMGN